MLSSIAAILQAVAWPLVAAFFLLVFRLRIATLLDILGQKLATASKFKAWQLELESTSEQIKQVVKEASDSAAPTQSMGPIPRSQIQAAEEVQARIRSSPLPDSRALPAVREELNSLIQRYDQIRHDLPSGPARTRMMLSVIAGMRALALAAQPLLPQLTISPTSGGRLAAVCTLQISPDIVYFDWLVERLLKETEAFLLGQTSVAVLELVKHKTYSDKAHIELEINKAIQHISSYKGGTPDQSSLEILRNALSMVA